ncbi:MAG TPA: hypothetical protein VER98_12895 [Terriglobia bacterium]|nr:hypothetical protein [Terriglobia bacterium]
MRNFRATISGISVLFMAMLLATAGDRPPDIENFGLSGPVHTVNSTVEKLSPDPRNRPLIPLWTACGNCSFDRRGYSISRAHVSDGALQIAHVEVNSDAQGWPTEERSYGDDGALRSRTVFYNGPYGPLDSESWIGDRQTSRSQNVYDEHGHTIVSRTWDESGLSVEILTRWGEHDEELEEIIRFPQSNGEDIQTTTYSANGDRSAIERRRNGDLLMRVTFDDERVTSWFMKKDANFGIGFGTKSEPGFTVNFGSEPQTGGLVRTEYVHPGRKGNIDPDEVREYDAAGTLAEKVTFDYDWDSFGNWTRRTAYVRDLTAGTPTAVQRVTRVISYY